jgi:DHA2 family multidrug resistance protein
LLGEPALKPTIGRIDWLGIFLLAVGVGSLQVVLERGETDDWFSANYIIVLSVTAAIGIGAFLWWQLKTRSPVVNLRVLRSKNLSVAAVLTFISGIGLYSSVYLTPVYAQRLLGFTPTSTGLLLLPGAILAIGGLLISARLLQRGISPVVMITSGMVMFIIFTWQLSHMDLDAGFWDISLSLIWRGVGLAIVTVPLSTLAISTLDLKDIPQGTALNNMMRQLGGSFGIAMVNTYLTRRNAVHRTDLITRVTDGDPAFTARLDSYTRYFVGKGAVLADARHQALGLVDNAVARQSNVLSFGDAYLLLGICFVVCLPLLLLTRRKKGARPQVALAEH